MAALHEITRNLWITAANRLPPDAILGVEDRFGRDPRSGKKNFGIGYMMEEGKIFVPPTITAARAIVHQHPRRTEPQYLSPAGVREWPGDPTFLEASARLVLRDYTNGLLENDSLAAAGTAGGTGAIHTWALAQRMAAENTMESTAPPTVLVSKPTWANHHGILKAIGLPLVEYEHIDQDGRFNMEGFLDAIANPNIDHMAVILHTGPTHNPTGINPQTKDEWRTIAQALQKHGRVALLDTAYAGFADGIEPDTLPIRIFYEEGVSYAVALSYSKIGGSYGSRVGALLVPADSHEEQLTYQRFINAATRAAISSPSAEGEDVITTVLTHPQLLIRWTQEDLPRAAALLRTRRQLLAEAIPQFKQVADGAGMFTMLPLTNQQVRALEEQWAIYMVGNRVNVGGIQPDDIPDFAEAVTEVLKTS